MSHHHTYGAAFVPDDAKTVIARLYAVEHADGVRQRDFVDRLQNAGYSVSERQLDRWVARVDAGEPAVSAEKASGAAAALSSEQRALLAG